MTAKSYRKKIEDATKAAGTYRPAFDTAIGILADILEKRDAAEQSYQDTGARPIILHTNKSLVTNPALKLEQELDALALSYLKELGLTAGGFERLKKTRSEKKADCKLEDFKSRFKVG